MDGKSPEGGSMSPPDKPDVPMPLRRRLITGFVTTLASLATGTFRPDAASAQSIHLPSPREMPPSVINKPEDPEPPKVDESPRAYKLNPIPEDKTPQWGKYFNNASENMKGNAEKILVTTQKIYSALGVEDFIDEVQVVTGERIAEITETEITRPNPPQGAAQITEDGRRIIYIVEGADSLISSVSTQIHELFHLFDPEMGGLNNLPAELVADWTARREEAMKEYDKYFFSQTKPLGNADQDVVTTLKDIPDKKEKARKEAFATTGERSILAQGDNPETLSDLQKLTAEIYEKISGQTIEQARAKIKAFGVGIS